MTTARRRLNNRRNILTQTFTLGGITYHGSIGYYDDHVTPGEVWLEGGTVGSDVQHTARSAAIGSSLAVQHGCPVKTISRALPKLSNGKPADALGTFLHLVADAT